MRFAGHVSCRRLCSPRSVSLRHREQRECQLLYLGNTSAFARVDLEPRVVSRYQDHMLYSDCKRYPHLSLDSLLNVVSHPQLQKRDTQEVLPPGFMGFRASPITGGGAAW
jgi:hypothetical protein